MRSILVWAAGIMLVAAAVGCAAKSDYSEAASKEWFLVEIKQNGGGVKIDRLALANEGFEGAFTIVFETDRVAGAGATNRYFAAYEAKGETIKLSSISSTRMAALKEPKALKERSFFAALQNAYKWKLGSNRLELFTKDANGKEATLIFEGK
jgi:heat shock protein HslJ